MIKQLLPVSSSLLPQRQLQLLGVTLKIAVLSSKYGQLELAGEWEQETFSMNNNQHLYNKYIDTLSDLGHSSNLIG